MTTSVNPLFWGSVAGFARWNGTDTSSLFPYVGQLGTCCFGIEHVAWLLVTSEIWRQSLSRMWFQNSRQEAAWVQGGQDASSFSLDHLPPSTRIHAASWKKKAHFGLWTCAMWLQWVEAEPWLRGGGESPESPFSPRLLASLQSVGVHNDFTNRNEIWKPFSCLQICLFILRGRVSRWTPWDKSPSSAGERGKEASLLGVNSIDLYSLSQNPAKSLGLQSLIKTETNRRA